MYELLDIVPLLMSLPGSVWSGLSPSLLRLFITLKLPCIRSMYMHMDARAQIFSPGEVVVLLDALAHTPSILHADGKH